jgi:hypothetical protein
MIKAIGAAVTSFALLAASAAAQAGTLTMGGWLFGSGNSVNVSTPTYSGLAGGFKGNLSGMTDARFNINPVEMYCVDLAESINISSGVTYSVKTSGEPGSTDFTLVSVASLFSSAVADRLTELISYAEAVGSRVDTSGESTSLQLAIWNTLYDADASLDGGSFKDTSSFRSYANTLLAASVGTLATKDLYVLRSVGNPGKQDQLIWVNKVPEPGTLALVSLAALGIALPRLRRRAA